MTKIFINVTTPSDMNRARTNRTRCPSHCSLDFHRFLLLVWWWPNPLFSWWPAWESNRGNIQSACRMCLAYAYPLSEVFDIALLDVWKTVTFLQLLLRLCTGRSGYTLVAQGGRSAFVLHIPFDTYMSFYLSLCVDWAWKNL